ncbi:glutathione S-transferase family protein [Pseudorhodoferax sp. Leaf267]|uniref:glutathione S-transferase family protein n=1 Tax=Pseudorhodoferax sp. Leaf267 TaxID=1736316 RepID=UPI0006F5BC2E|nr:glutathione S-transferase family protein [Pseudorhodoferax sp. Leaf267]KQP12265.1 glutathione S-transferase [Pseudorhodoferax sp. Leaf267]
MSDQPTLTVVGSYISPYVRKVLAVLEHKGLRYEIDPIVPFFGNAEFENLSPARRVPVLLHGDLAIVDSTVICEYLEDKWPAPAIWPAGAALRARARTLEEYADSVLGEVFIWRYFNQLVINRFVWNQAVDEDVLAKARDVEIPALLDHLEGQLPPEGTLFNTGLTLADIAIATPFRNLGFARYTVDATRWPRTAGFVGRVLGAPCFSALAPFEQICVRTPIPQQREALIAAGAPVSARTLGRERPVKGVLSK